MGFTVINVEADSAAAAKLAATRYMSDVQNSPYMGSVDVRRISLGTQNLSRKYPMNSTIRG